MKAARVVLASAVVLCSAVLVGNYLLKRNLQRAFTPLARAVGAKLGEAVTVPVGKEARVVGGNALFDTYSNAMQIAEYVVSHESSNQPPVLSTKVAGLDAGITKDAWGHPMCILSSPAGVGVASAGPNGSWAEDCHETTVFLKEMPGRTSGRLYQYPSGVLLLTLARNPSP